ncbi:helix-turn-helix domain-containing protein [Actinoplanes sp. NEAU-A12]|uniref:Helix-turn-helix domain-containing protein n=1 Tax=Actinoplanes sandaracinus TaxID=3045177 RepID=A0ABT6WI27_9ACTN|nr:helix-turn-helix domain-containing protein [Actinoplanes sandaracinus]MDI6099390.1 helix-turn-helix domain-containing protein [Actinoplanes sandaracinus]
MATRRTYSSYNDGCASAHALDLIGERWALIVVRELILGPKRFVDIQRDIPGIGPGALSRRLQDLEDSGIVVRRSLPRPAAVTLYDLTDWGRELEAVNAALSRWAVRSPALPVEADMSPDTLVLAMRAHARPASAGEPTRRIALTLTDSRIAGQEPAGYLATVGPGGTTVSRQPLPADVDAHVEATTLAWKTLVLGGPPPGDAAITVSGDAEAVRALVAATRLEIPG